MQYQEGNPVMNEAIEHARNTLNEFIEDLGENEPSRELFGVKMKVEGAFGNAYVWLIDVSHDDGIFEGTLVNTPRNTRTISAGEILRVPSEKVVDWSYVENGKLVGGYTMRVMYDSMPRSEQDALEEKLGFSFN